MGCSLGVRDFEPWPYGSLVFEGPRFWLKGKPTGKPLGKASLSTDDEGTWGGSFLRVPLFGGFKGKRPPTWGFLETEGSCSSGKPGFTNFCRTKDLTSLESETGSFGDEARWIGYFGITERAISKI